MNIKREISSSLSEKWGLHCNLYYVKYVWYAYCL